MLREYWKPEKKEIEEWFKKQIQEFAIKENHNKVDRGKVEE